MNPYLSVIMQCLYNPSLFNTVWHLSGAATFLPDSKQTLSSHLDSYSAFKQLAVLHALPNLPIFQRPFQGLAVTMPISASVLVAFSLPKCYGAHTIANKTYCVSLKSDMIH